MERGGREATHPLESPALLALLGAVGQAVLIEDASRRVFRLNQGFLDLFGVSAPAEAFIGVDSAERVRAVAGRFLDAEAVVPRIEAILSAGHEVRGEQLELLDGRVLSRDYVPIRDGGRCCGHLWLFRDITETKRLERALEASEERYRQFFEANRAVALLIDPASGRIVRANAAAEAFYGWSIATLQAMRIQDINLLSEDEVAAEMDRARRQARDHFLFRHRTASGERHVEVFSGPIGPEDEPLLYSIIRPIDDRVRAEREREELREQFLHAQRMEAIGRLAGGVAHDFNNLLTVIGNCADLLREKAERAGESPEALEQILGATQRAAELTRQLLAFGRKQMIEPRPIDLDLAVDAAQRMIRRLIGEHIRLEVAAAGEGACIDFDPGQLDQVLMNLAVNARDAMAAGGTLTIETRRLAAGRPELPVGLVDRDCLALSVADTGAGIDPETVARIFEPFFTTKAAGRGSGLGLSTVYGIVRQHGGWVEVSSSPGEGTRFDLFFPIVSAPPAAEETSAPRATPSAVGGTVLLVEDDGAVRAVVARILEAAGYRVIEAVDGADAVVRGAEVLDAIDLVVSDVRMPRLSGPECVRRLRERRPGLPALFMSGYTEERGALPPGARFLAKPFQRDELLSELRELLDAPAAGAEPP